MSVQDRYVPWHSARLATCEIAQHDSSRQRREAFAEMLEASTRVRWQPAALVFFSPVLGVVMILIAMMVVQVV